MRSGVMRRQATKSKSESFWQKLVSALALLATVMFMTHGAMAETLGLHVHALDAAQPCHTESSSDAKNWLSDSVAHHGSSSVADPQSGVDQHNSSACCGKACMAALVPDQAPRLQSPRGDQKSLVLACWLTGLSQEGPRRPPRTSN